MAVNYTPAGTTELAITRQKQEIYSVHVHQDTRVNSANIIIHVFSRHVKMKELVLIFHVTLSAHASLGTMETRANLEILVFPIHVWTAEIVQ